MILLDTCTLLWLVADQSRLSDFAREQIAGHAGSLFVLSISAFEIGVKHSGGRLELPLSPEAWFAKALELHGLTELPVDWRIAIRSTALPRLHADPCDRMLVAAAQLHGLTLLTPDPHIHSYPNSRAHW